MGVFTADHIIEPMDAFRRSVERGFDLAERSPETLVTFGITPTAPATGFGYLELGDEFEKGAYALRQFREKPDYATAEAFVSAGPERFLWNSGMFVWKAATLLRCIERYEPDVFAVLSELADAWRGPNRESAMASLFPTLKKISVDYAVMEPASRDPAVRVAAIPMDLEWLDVGSWPSFARTIPPDERGNAVASARALLHDSSGTLVVSDDPDHLIVAVGCDGLFIVHTAGATLVCRADRAEAVKDVHRMIADRFGPDSL
jgi:mannose-1-phosphate guanylyltransferase